MSEISRRTALGILGAPLLAMLAVGAAAGWVPARRSSRVDPVVALRAD